MKCVKKKKETKKQNTWKFYYIWTTEQDWTTKIKQTNSGQTKKKQKKNFNR